MKLSLSLYEDTLHYSPSLLAVGYSTSHIRLSVAIFPASVSWPFTKHHIICPFLCAGIEGKSNIYYKQTLNLTGPTNSQLLTYINFTPHYTCASPGAV